MKIDTAQQKYITALDSTRKIPSTKQAEESRQSPQPGNSAFSVNLSAQAQQAAAPDRVDEEARQAKIAAILKDAQEARAKAAIQQAPPHIYHG